jgi:hypothetical protein
MKTKLLILVGLLSLSSWSLTDDSALKSLAQLPA